jgi:hypothetical protein
MNRPLGLAMKGNAKTSNRLFERSYSNADLKSSGRLQKILRGIKFNQFMFLWSNKPGNVCG